MGRTERTPEAKNAVVPVFVPTTKNETAIEMGIASMKAGTLVIEFKNNLPGVAIQRMIERGVVLGISFVMLDEVIDEEVDIIVVETEENKEKTDG